MEKIKPIKPIEPIEPYNILSGLFGGDSDIREKLNEVLARVNNLGNLLEEFTDDIIDILKKIKKGAKTL